MDVTTFRLGPDHPFEGVDGDDRSLESVGASTWSELQDRVDDRINILTMISAIFLPLSLLAGIYGMNFEHMPGIGMRRGFWILMAVMLGIAFGLAWFFRRRRASGRRFAATPPPTYCLERS